MKFKDFIINDRGTVFKQNTHMVIHGRLFFSLFRIIHFVNYLMLLKCLLILML